MADEQDRLAHLLEFLKLVEAFHLEKDVSDRKCLIDDQNLRIDVDRNRKCQADKHTGTVCLDRLIYKITDVRKIKDILQSGINLCLREADHGTIQINIFNAGVFHIKPGTKFKQCGYSAVDLHITACFGKDTGNDLQDRGFTGTVCTDNTNALSLFDRQIHML